MPTLDYTQELLQIKDEYITRIENIDEQTIHVLITLPVKPHKCPCCGNKTSRIKDYRCRSYKDQIINNKILIIKYRQRRYACIHCKHTFSETPPYINKYEHSSARLKKLILESTNVTSSFTQIAKTFQVSITTVFRVFDQFSIPTITSLPEVISIDEFRGNIKGHIYQVILTNPINHTILDILPKRDSKALLSYFSRIPRSVRNTVKYIVMDMYNQFGSVMELAYHLYHDFRQWYYHSTSKESVTHFLDQWLHCVKLYKIPEFTHLLHSFNRWKKEIVNAFTLSYSNGFTEGCNNKIKVIKRNAYGFKRFDCFRKRILITVAVKKTTAN